MAFLGNRTVNLLNLHYGLHSLAVALRAGADADGGAGRKRAGDLAGQSGRDHFQHHHGSTCLFQRRRVVLHARRAGLVAALDPVAAERVHRLRR
jgi:hypothetical protein